MAKASKRSYLFRAEKKDNAPRMM